MGVRGLSTFLQSHKGQYSEKVLVRNQCLVIDGSNLMFYLFFQEPWRTPHLFGGDFIAYAARIREFFDNLRAALIRPIVIVDGAMEQKKIDTVLKRFLSWLNSSLKVDAKYPRQGCRQHSVWKSVIFHEILAEMNVLQLQTEWEADDTIALVAKRLQCPILSCDSDFYVHKDLQVISLDAFTFTDRFTLSEKTQMKVPASKKCFAMRCSVLNAQKVWEKEFGITDVRMLTLATALLGNDYIESHTFRKVLSAIDGFNPDLRSAERITVVMKWIGSKDSFDKGLSEILEGISNEKHRKDVRDTIFLIMKGYLGENGEAKIIETVQAALKIRMVDETNAPENNDEEEEADVLLDETAENEDILTDKLAENLSLDEIEESDDEDIDVDSKEIPEDLKHQIDSRAAPLPDWFLQLYYKCLIPDYLLKIAYNKALLLYPQFELETEPSSHNLSIPIIQVTAGIILGMDTFVLVTSSGKKMTKLLLNTTLSFDSPDGTGIVHLPLLCDDSFRGQRVEDRRNIVLRALDLTPNEISFLCGWPQSIQFTVAAILSFIKKLRTPISMAVALSILISSIKRFLFADKGVASVSQNWRSDKIDGINDFLHNPSGPRSRTRQFYKRFEKMPDTRRDFVFRDTYDRAKLYVYTQYKCLLKHTAMLNALLGKPFIPARATELHCHLIYNTFVRIAEKEFMFMDFIAQSFDGGFAEALKQFANFACGANQVHLNGYFNKTAKKQKKPGSASQTVKVGKPQESKGAVQNRFAFLGDDD